MSYFWFEVRYLLCAIPTLSLLAQFKILIWLEKHAPRPFYVVFGIPFALQDILYNATCGSFFFLERPKEWLFTTRLKRLDDAGTLPGCIGRFKLTLNEIDPGHV